MNTEFFDKDPLRTMGLGIPELISDNRFNYEGLKFRGITKTPQNVLFCVRVPYDIA